MPKHESITDAQRERIEQLCIDGMPRNRIAAEVGVAAGTVSKYVREAGLSFDRASTRAACAAAQADGALINERILAGVRAGLLRTIADLEQRSPRDIREAGQKARAYADLGSALAAVNRSTPPPKIPRRRRRLARVPPWSQWSTPPRWSTRATSARPRAHLRRPHRRSPQSRRGAPSKRSSTAPCRRTTRHHFSQHTGLNRRSLAVALLQRGLFALCRERWPAARTQAERQGKLMAGEIPSPRYAHRHG